MIRMDKRAAILRNQTFSDAEADLIILRYTISRLESDAWDNGLDLSAEAQGTLVRASNRLARQLQAVVKAAKG